MRRFHVFVANRIQFIKTHTQSSQWQYVGTDVNPADCVSRGLPVADLMTTNWYAEPSFLLNETNPQPLQVSVDLMVGDPELRAQCLTTVTCKADILHRFTRFSDWITLIRVIARCLRLSKPDLKNKELSVEEMNNASLMILKLVQEEAFPKEIKYLRQNKSVPASGQLSDLNPYIEDGLVRVGGRLRKSSLSLQVKHPIVLPKKGHVTNLIILHAHKQVQHQGRGFTLQQTRNLGYWILGGSRRVADFIRNCVLCRKLRRPVETQLMADFPEDRVNPSPPFTFCGMDCFGPYSTKQHRKECKRYGL